MAILDNMIGYYPMNDPIGSTVAKDVFFGHDLLSSGGANFDPSSGIFSGSVRVAPANYLEINHPLFKLTGSCTMVGWFKLPLTPSPPTDVHPFDYGIDTNYYCTFHVASTPQHWYGIQTRWNLGQSDGIGFNTLGSFVFKGNQWVFMATTYEDTLVSTEIMRGYYGYTGSLKTFGTSKIGFTGSNASSTLRVAWSQVSASNVMIWNRTLSSGEISWLYNSGSGRYLEFNPGQMVYFRDANYLLVTKMLEQQTSGSELNSVNPVGYLKIAGQIIESASYNKEFELLSNGDLVVRQLQERWI